MKKIISESQSLAPAKKKARSSNPDALLQLLATEINPHDTQLQSILTYLSTRYFQSTSLLDDVLSRQTLGPALRPYPLSAYELSELVTTINKEVLPIIGKSFLTSYFAKKFYETVQTALQRHRLSHNLTPCLPTEIALLGSAKAILTKLAPHLPSKQKDKLIYQPSSKMMSALHHASESDNLKKAIEKIHTKLIKIVYTTEPSQDYPRGLAFLTAQFAKIFSKAADTSDYATACLVLEAIPSIFKLATENGEILSQIADKFPDERFAPICEQEGILRDIAGQFITTTVHLRLETTVPTPYRQRFITAFKKLDRSMCRLHSLG